MAAKPKLFFGGEGLLEKAEKKGKKAKPSEKQLRESAPVDSEKEEVGKEEPAGTKKEIEEEKIKEGPVLDPSEIKKAVKQELKGKHEEIFKEIHNHKPIGHPEAYIAESVKVKHKKPPKIGIERTPTGIPGLDEVIEGGLKKDSVTLIGGCAGSGKSIFAMQFIVNGILNFNEPGVYVTFEEDKEELYEDMLRFGWNLNELEKQGKFAFIRYTPEQVGKVLKTGGGVIRDIADKMNAKRIVIDSISAFTLLHTDELEKREACLELFKILRKWKCTTLVIGQYYAAEERRESTAIEFEVDGIIWLYNIKKEDIRTRAIEVFKMRGTKHSAKIFPFEITNEGIIIYPEQSVF